MLSKNPFVTVGVRNVGYNLTEIQFCPQSVNGEKGQAALNKKYCNKRKFVLADEWERYGSYGGILPFKGDAIMKVRDLPSDNPYL
ncbi:MAG: hypothetical protein AAF757_23455 [Cyanobacteria bacterium P01_D01_bin.116]